MKRTGFSNRQWWLIGLSFIICLFSFSSVGAQTFTQRLQQKQSSGKATVTIHQSADIDNLVNNAELTPKSAVAAPATPAPPATTTTASSSARNSSHGNSSTGSGNNSTGSGYSSTGSDYSSTGNSSSGSGNGKTGTSYTGSHAQSDSPEMTESESPAPVEPTKKKIRGGYKIPGYRVQAFAGGNSRKDRQQAERIGNNIKMQFADTPVYVHFYSPRWICRVGNYRTYEEAHQMLLSLRKLGYSQATIVKGKITVAY